MARFRRVAVYEREAKSTSVKGWVTKNGTMVKRHRRRKGVKHASVGGFLEHVRK